MLNSCQYESKEEHDTTQYTTTIRNDQYYHYSIVIHEYPCADQAAGHLCFVRHPSPVAIATTASTLRRSRAINTPYTFLAKLDGLRPPPYSPERLYWNLQICPLKPIEGKERSEPDAKEDETIERDRKPVLCISTSSHLSSSSCKKCQHEVTPNA